jgi:TP901 family phage tail tape measure protein
MRIIVKVINQSQAEFLKMQKQIAALEAQLARANARAAGLGASTGKAGAAAAGATGRFARLGATVSRMGAAFHGAGAAMESWGRRITYAGRRIAYGLGLPITAIIGLSAKMALANERAMTRVAKVYGDFRLTAMTVRNELNALRVVVRELSDEFGVSIEDVTRASEAFAAAGSSGLALAKQTRLALEVSILGEMDLAQSTKTLIAVQAQYGLSTKQLKKAIAELNQVENQTATSFPDLLMGFQRSAGFARQAGVDVRHLAAMLAALVPAAGSASQAGNALKTIYSRIGGDVNNVLESVGIQTNRVSWHSKNLTERLEYLAKRVWPNLTQQEKINFATMAAGVYQASRFAILMDDLGKKAGYYHRALKATNSDQRVFAQYSKELMTQLTSTPQAFTIMTTQLKNMMVQIIMPLLPTLLALTERLVKMVDAFASLDPAIQQLILGAALLIAVLGPVMIIFGSFVEMLGYLRGILTFVFKGFGLLSGVLKYIGRGIWAVLDAVWGMLTGVAGGFWSLFGTMVRFLALLGVPIEAAVAAVVATIAAILGGLAYLFRDQLGSLGNWVGQQVQNIGEFFTNLGQHMVDVFHRLPQSVQAAMMAVVQLVAAAAHAVYELFQYFNPFAHHSPSLVENVQRGVAIVAKEYASLGDIGRHFRRAVNDLRAFGRATRGLETGMQEHQISEDRKIIAKARPSALPSFDAMHRDINILTNDLYKIQVVYDRVSKHVNYWQNRLDAANAAVDRQQRIVNRLADAADRAQERVNLLNGEIELLNGQRVDLRLAGAGSDVIGPITRQINRATAKRDRLEGPGGPIAAYNAAKDALDAIERKQDRVQAQFDKWNDRLSRLADAYSSIKQQIDAMISAMDQFADTVGRARSAGVGGLKGDPALAGGNFDMPGGKAGLGREGGFADQSQAMLDLADKWAKEAQERFGSLDLVAPIRRRWEALKKWLSDHVHELTDALNSVNLEAGGFFEPIKKEAKDFADWIMQGPLAPAIRGIGLFFKPIVGIVKDVWRFISTDVWDTVKTVWDFISGLTDDVIDEFRSWSDLIEPVTKVFAGIVAAGAVFIWGLLNVLRLGLRVIMGVWHVVWPTLKGVIVPIFNFIRQFIHHALQVIHGILQFVLGVITGDWGLAWKGIKNIFAGAWHLIIDVLQVIIGVILGLIKGFAISLWRLFKNVILDPFLWLVRKIGGIGESIGEAIAGGFRSGVNTAIDILNTLADGINWISGKLHLGFTIPDIPKWGGGGGAGTPGTSYTSGGAGGHLLAQGGTIPYARVGSGWVTDGARAIVGEGNPVHPEYVVPTDPKYRNRALALWSSLGESLGIAMATGGMVPTRAFGLGGDIWDGAKKIGGAVKGVVGAGGHLLRTGAVKVFFAPLLKAADAMIGHIPVEFLREIMTSIKNRIYNWALGKGGSSKTDAHAMGAVLLGARSLRSIPGLADGGIIRATPGGSIVRIGEGRHDEAVVPLTGKGLGGDYHFHGDLVFPNIKSGDDAKKFIDNLRSVTEAA